MELIPGSNNAVGAQSFWETKYGQWWKWGGIAALGAAILFKLGPIFAYLLVIAGNIWLLGAHAIGFFIVFKLLSSRQVRTFIDIVFGSMGYFITDWFFGISPEASGKSILALLKQAIERVKIGLQTLSGKLEITDSEIKECKTKIKNSNTQATQIAQYAADETEKAQGRGGTYDSTGDEGEITVHKREAERYQSLLEELVPFRTDLVGLMDDFGKLQRELTNAQVDRENELNFMLKRRSVLKDIGTVMRSMKDVLQGGNLAEYYDRLKTKVKIENDQRTGEMKAFLRDLDPMITRIDRNNAIAAKEARTMIEGFMNQSKLLTSNQPLVAIEHASSPQAIHMGSNIDYAKVLREKTEKPKN